MSSLKNKVLLVVLVFILMACQVTAVGPTVQPATAVVQPTSQPTANQANHAELSPTVEEQPGVVPTLPATPKAFTPTLSAEQTIIDNKNASLLKQVGQVSFDNPANLIWSADGSTLAVMNNGNLDLLDAKTFENKGSVVFKTPIVLLDFSSDGHSMATTPDQNTVELRDVTSGKTVTSFKPGAPFSSLAFSPDGKTVALTSVDEIMATLWQVEGGKLIGKLGGFQTAAPVYDVSFSPNGKALVWHARAQVQLMDIATQKLGPSFEHEDFVSALAVSQDGSLLATSAGGTVDGNLIPLVFVWNAQNGSTLQKIKPPDNCTALAFSPKSHLLAGGAGNQVVLWDADSGQQSAALQGHSDRVSAIAFSPDGKLLATAAADNSVRLWQVKP